MLDLESSQGASCSVVWESLNSFYPTSKSLFLSHWFRSSQQKEFFVVVVVGFFFFFFLIMCIYMCVGNNEK